MYGRVCVSVRVCMLMRARFYALGCRFTKWRAVFSVVASELAIQDNVSVLAQFAVMSQQRGMVPIVEPEIMVAEGTLSNSSACLQ